MVVHTYEYRASMVVHTYYRPGLTVVQSSHRQDQQSYNQTNVLGEVIWTVVRTSYLDSRTYVPVSDHIIVSISERQIEARPYPRT